MPKSRPKVDEQLFSTGSREKFGNHVRDDVKDAKKVSFDSWTAAIFGVGPVRFDQWMGNIRSRHLFGNATTQQHLRDFCSSRDLEGRSAAFVGLCNHIVDFASSKGLTGDNSQSETGLHFVDYRKSVKTVDGHHGLGAIKRPTILGLHHSVATRVAKPKKHARWSDVLLTVELKVKQSLQQQLEKTKKRRTPSKMVSGTQPAKRRQVDDLLAGLGDSDDEGGDWQATLRETKTEVSVLAASYALEALSCSYGTRLHTLGIIVIDDGLSLWYYDASGVAYTVERISLLANFDKFAAIILGFTFLPPARFGMLPPSIFRPGAPYSESFPPQNLKGYSVVLSRPLDSQPVRVTLEQSLYNQYVLVGRHTFVYSIETDPKTAKEGYILKASYQVASRPREDHFVAIARKEKVAHIAKVHMAADLWKMSDGARAAFRDLDSNPINYEDRCLRAIVYTAYSPIQPLFKKNINLMPVMVDQMIDCLHDLYHKAGILHRDISLGNIMWHMRGPCYWFVLVDFDMAVTMPNEINGVYIASSIWRTGTLPFMDQDLIGDTCGARFDRNDDEDWIPVRHTLRHDITSLFYICVWCVMTLFQDDWSPRYQGRMRSWLKSWKNNDNPWMAGPFNECLATGGIEEWAGSLPRSVEHLRPWFDAWRWVFVDARSARHKHWNAKHKAERQGRECLPFDEDTMDGTFTRDILKAALTPKMPFRQDEIEESFDDSDEEESGPTGLPQQGREDKGGERGTGDAAIIPLTCTGSDAAQVDTRFVEANNSHTGKSMRATQQKRTRQKGQKRVRERAPKASNGDGEHDSNSKGHKRRKMNALESSEDIRAPPVSKGRKSTEKVDTLGDDICSRLRPRRHTIYKY